MHIRRAAVPVSEERDTPSSSLALLPLLSLSVLALIVLFFAVRLFKRSLHLPSLTWLRGKGQGARGRLGLSGVELLPISLKSIPTPNPSPYAASFNIEGNAGKNTALLARSSSLDELSPFPASTPPSQSTSPRSRPQFNLPSLFKSKNKSLHRRSKSLGLPTRHLLPPATSLTNGSSAPSTPQSLLIDFSASTSSTSTSSDLGTQKFSPASPPLIPGLPIPLPSPARHPGTKPHMFPSSSHILAFDDDDVEDGADPLLAVFKRVQPTTPPKLQSDSHPLIRYDRSPSPLRVPPTPSFEPRRLETANPFAGLNAALTRPLSPSPLSLSPSSPPGIGLVLTKPIVASLGSSASLMDSNADEQLDVTDATQAIDRMASIAILATSSVSPSSLGADDPFDYVQSAAEHVPHDHTREIEAEPLDREELVADPFDDVHGIFLSEDAWDLPASSTEHFLSRVSTPPLDHQLLSDPSLPVLNSPAAALSSLAVPASPNASPDLDSKSLAASWLWDNTWSPVPLPVAPQTSNTVSQADMGVEDKDEAENPAVNEADVISSKRHTAIEVEELTIAVDVEQEADPTDTWFMEEHTAVWDAAWSNEALQAGPLFGKGVDEEEEEEVHDVQIPILDGLLAGPSAPVDIQVTEEPNRVRGAPSHEDDQEDEHDDIHDITANPVADPTATTTSLLSTPTTPSTPLPALPSIIAESFTVEDCPDPELLPLPVLPLSTLSVSPVLVSPQPIKPLSPVYPFSPAQTPTPPASPPPTHNVPTRPLWSLRAADAPPLGIAATAMSSPAPVRATLVPLVAAVSAAVPETSTPVENESVDDDIVPAVSGPAPQLDVVENAGVTVVVDPPTEEQQEMPEGEHSVTRPFTALSTSLPGTFPSSPSPPSASLPALTPAQPSALLFTFPTASETTEAPSSSEASPPATRAVQLQNSAGSHRLRTPRSALDLALAMQLRPGLGAGADPAWMVRFLMALFGWVAVLVSGDI